MRAERYPVVRPVDFRKSGVEIESVRFDILHGIGKAYLAYFRKERVPAYPRHRVFFLVIAASHRKPRIERYGGFAGLDIAYPYVSRIRVVYARFVHGLVAEFVRLILVRAHEIGSAPREIGQYIITHLIAPILVRTEPREHIGINVNARVARESGRCRHAVSGQETRKQIDGADIQISPERILAVIRRKIIYRYLAEFGFLEAPVAERFEFTFGRERNALQRNVRERLHTYRFEGSGETLRSVIRHSRRGSECQCAYPFKSFAEIHARGVSLTPIVRLERSAVVEHIIGDDGKSAVRGDYYLRARSREPETREYRRKRCTSVEYPFAYRIFRIIVITFVILIFGYSGYIRRKRGTFLEKHFDEKRFPECVFTYFTHACGNNYGFLQTVVVEIIVAPGDIYPRDVEAGATEGVISYLLQS